MYKKKMYELLVADFHNFIVPYLGCIKHVPTSFPTSLVVSPSDDTALFQNYQTICNIYLYGEKGQYFFKSLRNSSFDGVVYASDKLTIVDCLEFKQKITSFKTYGPKTSERYISRYKDTVSIVQYAYWNRSGYDLQLTYDEWVHINIKIEKLFIPDVLEKIIQNKKAFLEFMMGDYRDLSYKVPLENKYKKLFVNDGVVWTRK